MTDPLPSLVVFLRPSAAADSLAGGLSEASRRLSERFPQALARTAVDAGLLDQTDHAAETAAGPGFRAVLHSRFPGEASVPTGVGLVIDESFGPELDRAASAAVVGTEHVIVPGDHPLLLAMSLRRLSSLSSPDFLEHWSTVHAELGRRVPGSQGYRQLRPDPAASQRVSAEAGVGVADLDGVALAYFTDEAAMFGILGNPDVAGPLLEDERTFIDHSASGIVCGWPPTG